MDDPNSDEKTTSPLDVFSVPCSICLDLVKDNGDRSIAKLQCGHEFHLDCIGSAFNVKGAMQCPNCRKVERGQWLFASNSTCTFPDFAMDEWTPDDYALNYSEMPLGVHWCPFSGLAQLQSAFEEVESASTYHNLHRHHPISSVSSLSHSYVAFLGPIPPSSSNVNENVEDPNFNLHWNGQNDIFPAHSFPVIDVQYQSWGHHSYPVILSRGHIHRTDRAPVNMRPTGSEYDSITRSGSVVHPSFHSHRRSHERTSASHQQRQLSNPLVVGRSNNGLRTFQSDQSVGFFTFPPPGSSRRNPHESENPSSNHRNHLFHPVAESAWGSFRQPGGGFDSTNRSGNFWNRHRS